MCLDIVYVTQASCNKYFLVLFPSCIIKYSVSRSGGGAMVTYLTIVSIYLTTLLSVFLILITLATSSEKN